MLGRRLAPGLNRSFAAEHWQAIRADVWAKARQEAADLALPSLPQRIIGGDADAESLKLARHHAQLAGVAEDIHFQQRDFAELSSSRASNSRSRAWDLAKRSRRSSAPSSTVVLL